MTKPSASELLLSLPLSSLIHVTRRALLERGGAVPLKHPQGVSWHSGMITERSRQRGRNSTNVTTSTSTHVPGKKKLQLLHHLSAW